TSKLLDKKIERKRIVKSTEKERVIGTWAYMAPEQIAGDPLSYATDVFALGVIGYELLTGVHPFLYPNEEGELPNRIVVGNRIVFTNPKPIGPIGPGIPDDVAEITNTAMAKRPHQRYPSMRELVQVLRTARGVYLARRGLPVAPLRGLVGVFPA